VRILRSLARRFVPKAVRHAVGRYLAYPPVGSVDFGDLRQVRPISKAWGYDRGKPIDRHYIETFLEAYADDMRGRALEVKDDQYLRRYGRRVERRDILQPVPGGAATVVADLTRAEQVPEAAFDTFVCTQVLHFVADLEAAIAGCRRLLRPGGVLLATVPCLARVEDAPEDSAGDYWRFTLPSTRRLFGGVFGDQNVQIEQYGNVLAAVAFLHGLAAEELSAEELAVADPAFPVIVGIRARVAERGIP